MISPGIPTQYQPYSKTRVEISNVFSDCYRYDVTTAHSAAENIESPFGHKHHHHKRLGKFYNIHN